MRSLLVLVLIQLSGAACSKEPHECKQILGEEKSPPTEVIERLRFDLKNHKLIDRKECGSEVFWLAIPADQPVNESRVVGQGRLVVFNKKTKEILVLQGQ